MQFSRRISPIHLRGSFHTLVILLLLAANMPAQAVPPSIGGGVQISGTSLANQPIVYTEADADPVVRVGLGMTGHLTSHISGRWGLRLTVGYTHYLLSGQRFTIRDPNRLIPQDGYADVRTTYNSLQGSLLFLYSLDFRQYFFIGPSLQQHDYTTKEEGRIPTGFIDVWEYYSEEDSWSELRGGISLGMGRRMSQRSTLELIVNIDDSRTEVACNFSLLAPLRFLSGSR